MATKPCRSTSRAEYQEAARKKIQTTALVTRLTKHILGEVEMTSTQVTAALGLIRKTLPDLAAEHITTSTANSLEDWLKALPKKR